MDADCFPRYSLRDELVRVLAIHAERSKRGRLPVLPPRGVLEALNEFGPRLDDRWIRVIEATLDGLWQDGLIGRIPAPSASHVSGYCSRRAAERAILLGAPIIVMPLRTGARSRRDRGTERKERHHDGPLATGRRERRFLGSSREHDLGGTSEQA